MKVFTSEGSAPIKAWVEHVPPIEEASMKQLRDVAKLPFIHKHVAVMPDVHWGNGTSVGSVIATKGAVIPAAVGVDLGCGMCAVKTNLRADQLPDNLFGIRSAIEAVVPHGRSSNGGAGDVGAWGGKQPGYVNRQWASIIDEFTTICDKHPAIARCNTVEHLGTLGTGNHFIELCLDENDCVWVMLHSGSRGVGNRIGSHFISLAKKEMQQWFINVPDVNLAYLPEGSQYFGDYMQAVGWAQEYAALNRKLMMAASLSAIQGVLGTTLLTEVEAINCHHNYVTRESHFGDNVLVTRKGAVQAREGTLGIIPVAMGRASFIVRGKGNRDSFCSCSHGAGRVMSRTEAKKRITLEDHARETAGVECRKDSDVIDESPQAYKNVEDVMRSQSDLVEVLHRLKAIICVKG
jgi:tRNA-splicing ligase RtcB